MLQDFFLGSVIIPGITFPSSADIKFAKNILQKAIN